ncbi:MAG: type II toxin-antitoxin system RelE/ParE family toxin [Chitinivibrionales bacterium]|nr:type II toxin-antitoxin system RelE/ParE family toxin [Chitinivibrionales bacterium]
MKIQWTIPAVNDLESIRDYIARDSELYAASFIEKILGIVDLLNDSPEIGRIVPEANDRAIREMIFQNYRIMYRLHSNSVQIIAIIRGSRDIARWPLKPWEVA